MTPVKIILFMFAAFSVAGCQTLKAPSTMYEEWKPPASRAPDQVWNSMLEQKIDLSKPLALVKLVDIALHNNPSTRQAWDTARAAEAKKRQAESVLYPQVTASASLDKKRVIATQDEYGANSLGYGPKIDITYLILDFGGRAATIDAAYETMIAANFQFNQAFQDLLLSVETSYYDLHSSYAGLKAAEADLENAKTSFFAARQRYEVGLVAKLDVLQAKSNYENSLFKLEDAKGQIKTAKANLAKSIGFPADTPFEISEPAEKIPTDIGEDNVSSLIKEAIEKRADISALRASLRAKRALIKAARSDLWPTLDGSGSTAAMWHKLPGGQISENGIPPD
jgi:outer membrane protein